MSPLAAERAVDTENFICVEGRRGNRCGKRENGKQNSLNSSGKTEMGRGRGK